jgi:HSP20 family molecular chaperone IbpA
VEADPGGPGRLLLPSDVWETDDDYVHAFDLPGPKGKVSVEFEDSMLAVSAERELIKRGARD